MIKDIFRWGLAAAVGASGAVAAVSEPQHVNPVFPENAKVVECDPFALATECFFVDGKWLTGGPDTIPVGPITQLTSNPAGILEEYTNAKGRIVTHVKTNGRAITTKK